MIDSAYSQRSGSIVLREPAISLVIGLHRRPPELGFGLCDDALD